MYKRNITPGILAALNDTPVSMIVGARQTGKTTLVQKLAAKDHPARYITFDDLSMRGAATRSPQGFLSGFTGPVVFDEIQMVPDLLPAIKMAVDTDRKPGRFVLTGSANVLALPRVSESLAGRMALFTLYPLSQGELKGRCESFIDAVFSDTLSPHRFSPLKLDQLWELITCGGYPEAQVRHDPIRRTPWFRDYINTILQRDIEDLAHIEGLVQLPTLLSLLASRVGSLANAAEISRALQLPQTTLKRYLSLLESVFLVWRLPPWSANLGKRLVKTSKLYFTDTGLAMHLVGAESANMIRGHSMSGFMLENFVLSELQRQAAWSAIRPRLYHLREQTGKEADVVLESADGRCVLMEIKHGDAVRPDDLKNLRWIASQMGPRFLRGILLYTGNEIIPYDRQFMAMPIQSLWLLE